MSDSSQGEGWWQGEDGKWYPPGAADRTASGLDRPASIDHGVESIRTMLVFVLMLLSAIVVLLALIAFGVVDVSVVAGEP